jgi:hypothetical protein
MATPRHQPNVKQPRRLLSKLHVEATRIETRSSKLVEHDPSCRPLKTKRSSISRTVDAGLLDLAIVLEL